MLQMVAKQRHTAVHVAAVALTVLLTAAQACADVPSTGMISAGGLAPGPPARPSRSARQAQPDRPARPTRPRGPNSGQTSGGVDAVMPDPATPVIEPPAGATPAAPPTDVPGGELLQVTVVNTCIARTMWHLMGWLQPAEEASL